MVSPSEMAIEHVMGTPFLRGVVNDAQEATEPRNAAINGYRSRKVSDAPGGSTTLTTVRSIEW